MLPGAAQRGVGGGASGESDDGDDDAARTQATSSTTTTTKTNATAQQTPLLHHIRDLFRGGAPAARVADAACGYEYEMQQYSGYAHDTSVARAHAQRQAHSAFCTDFQRGYAPPSVEQLCRVPTLWQCLKNALAAPSA
jgi:hypothetical protein